MKRSGVWQQSCCCCRSMDNLARNACDICGNPVAKDRIYFSRGLSEAEQETYGAPRTELDMLLCEVCGARAFKHLKRMFTLKDFGLRRKPADYTGWSTQD